MPPPRTAPHHALCVCDLIAPFQLLIRKASAAAARRFAGTRTAAISCVVLGLLWLVVTHHMFPGVIPVFLVSPPSPPFPLP